MPLNPWGRRLALGVVLIAMTLACRTTDVLVAQATITPTRARPTFTPPPPTLTPTPEPTATRTHTPTARPTARPPTAIPQPTAPPATVFPYIFHALLHKCEHAGDTYIKGSVYADKNDPNSKIYGAIITFAGSPDGERAAVVKSEDTYSLILDRGTTGNFFVWIVKPNMERISEMSPMISFNNKGPGDPSACWAAILDFWKEPGR